MHLAYVAVGGFAVASALLWSKAKPRLRALEKNKPNKARRGHAIKSRPLDTRPKYAAALA